MLKIWSNFFPQTWWKRVQLFSEASVNDKSVNERAVNSSFANRLKVNTWQFFLGHNLVELFPGVLVILIGYSLFLFQPVFVGHSLGPFPSTFNLLFFHYILSSTYKMSFISKLRMNKRRVGNLAAYFPEFSAICLRRSLFYHEGYVSLLLGW